MGLTQDLMHWNFWVHKCNPYAWASQAIGNWAHCCIETVTLPHALNGRTPRSHYSDCNQVSMTTCEWVTHDCQMWSDFGYLHIWWRDAKTSPTTPIVPEFSLFWWATNCKNLEFLQFGTLLVMLVITLLTWPIRH